MAVNLQKKILAQLDKYGDGFLDEKDYQQRKRKARRQTSTSTSRTSAGPIITAEPRKTVSRKQKKKMKKKKMLLEEANTLHSAGDISAGDVDEEVGQLTNHEKQLLQFKKDLGLTDDDFRKIRSKETEQKKEAPVTQSESSGNMRSQRRPEVVVFEDPAKRKSKKRSLAKAQSQFKVEEEPSPDQDGPHFDLKRARYDVQKFGITGLEDTYKEKAITSLLVKLGAKPPKREYENYKKLQERRKTEKVASIEKRAVDRSLGYKVSSSANAQKKGKRSRDKNDVGFVDGQVGSYKRGVQVVSDRIIEHVKKSKGKGRRKIGAAKGVKL